MRETATFHVATRQALTPRPFPKGRGEVRRVAELFVARWGCCLSATSLPRGGASTAESESTVTPY